jgi:hypothetical protein
VVQAPNDKQQIAPMLEKVCHRLPRTDRDGIPPRNYA